MNVFPDLNQTLKLWAAIHKDRVITAIDIMIGASRPAGNEAPPNGVNMIAVGPNDDFSDMVLIRLSSFALIQQTIESLEDMKRLVYPDESRVYDDMKGASDGPENVSLP